MPTALTAYLTSTNDTLITTARQASSTAPTSETSVTGAKIAKSTGWVQLASQGGTKTPVSSEPAVSSDGFIWDVTTLEGQEIPAGNWTPTVKLQTSAGSIVGTIVVRAWVYNGGTFTQIGSDMSLTGKTINTTATAFAFAATALPAQAFNTGDKLYFDVLVDITSNSTGSNTATLKLYENGGVGKEQVVTPGYQAQPISGTGAVSQSSILAGTAAETFSGSGGIGEHSSLSATAAETFTASGSLAETSTLSASGSVTASGGVSGSGTVSQKSILTATAVETFSGSGGLSQRSSLAASATEKFAATGGVRQSSRLAATAAETFSATAAISETSRLAGAGLVVIPISGAGGICMSFALAAVADPVSDAVDPPYIGDAGGGAPPPKRPPLITFVSAQQQHQIQPVRVTRVPEWLLDAFLRGDIDEEEFTVLLALN